MLRPILLKAIAAQEFVGGLSGAFVAIGLLIGFARAGVTVERLAAFVVGVAIYLLAIFAGVMLWRDRLSGYIASAMVQFVQLIKIASPQFVFLFGFGADMSIVSITRPDSAGRPVRLLVYDTHIGPQAGIEFSRPPGAIQVFGVSVIACVSLAVLRKGRQLVAAPGPLPDDGGAVRIGDGRGDGQPDWVMPFWLKFVFGLFVVVVVSCAGLNALSR